VLLFHPGDAARIANRFDSACSAKCLCSLAR
jgi:hypothetical protein